MISLSESTGTFGGFNSGGYGIADDTTSSTMSDVYSVPIWDADFGSGLTPTTTAPTVQGTGGTWGNIGSAVGGIFSGLFGGGTQVSGDGGILGGVSNVLNDGLTVKTENKLDVGNMVLIGCLLVAIVFFLPKILRKIK